jgi:cytochrome c-type biogenesis protein CcmH
MIVFWFAAAALAGGAALLVMLFARKAAGAVGAENPALAVHRRQLAEIDDLAERGLIGAGDKAAARAEAARRLLAGAAMTAVPETAGSAASRRIAAAVVVAAAAGALGLYLWLGAAGTPDQPYKARLTAWRKSDPSTLDAARLAAVLQSLADTRPNDPQLFGYLGRAEMAAGDSYAAQKALARAVRLAPGNAALQLALGQAYAAGSDGKPSPDAGAAFQRAVTLAPKNLSTRYALGVYDVTVGDRSGGLVLWRSMLSDLSPNDPRRPALSVLIDRVAAGGPIQPPEPAGAGGAEAAGESAFIRAMVAKQAAALEAHPDDPQGWARLVRSYGVLHDRAGQADALARARKQFANKPAALAAIEAEAKAHPA